MAPPHLVTPDLLVALATYVIAGLLLRFAAGDRRWTTFGAFGVVLGLGYLAKEVLLPIGLVALVLALAVVGPTRRGWPGIALAALTFLVVAAPFVGALSLARGRVTVGDSGRLNLLWSAHAGGADRPVFVVLEAEPALRQDR